MREIATGLQHIGIPTPCYRESLEFYKKIGFWIQYETQLPDTKDRVSFLKLNGLTVELYENRGIMREAGPIDHICIDVVDIKLAYTYICKMDCIILDQEIRQLPFWERGIQFFTIMGPNHEKIEFCQRL